MSLDLSVEHLPNQVNIGNLILAHRSCLEKLVGERMPEGITISYVKMDAGHPSLAQPPELKAEWSGYIYLNEKHRVELCAFRLSDTIQEVSGNDPMRPEYHNLNAYFSLHGGGGASALTWLFWAASAMALATASGSRVTDNNLYWSKIYEQEPEDFLATVKAAKPPVFFEQARQELQL